MTYLPSTGLHCPCQEPRTQPTSPTWAAGPRVLDPARAASRGAHWQGLELEAEPALEPGTATREPSTPGGAFTAVPHACLPGVCTRTHEAHGIVEAMIAGEREASAVIQPEPKV